MHGIDDPTNSSDGNVVKIVLAMFIKRIIICKMAACPLRGCRSEWGRVEARPEATGPDANAVWTAKRWTDALGRLKGSFSCTRFANMSFKVVTCWHSRNEAWRSLCHPFRTVHLQLLSRITFLSSLTFFLQFANLSFTLFGKVSKLGKFCLPEISDVNAETST